VAGVAEEEEAAVEAVEVVGEVVVLEGVEVPEVAAVSDGAVAAMEWGISDLRY